MTSQPRTETYEEIAYRVLRPALASQDLSDQDILLAAYTIERFHLDLWLRLLREERDTIALCLLVDAEQEELIAQRVEKLTELIDNHPRTRAQKRREYIALMAKRTEQKRARYLEKEKKDE